MPRFIQERRSAKKRSAQSTRARRFKQYKKKREYLKVKNFLPTPKEITIVFAKAFIKKLIEIIFS